MRSSYCGCLRPFHLSPLPLLRFAALVAALAVSASDYLFAQSQALVFTVAVPETRASQSVVRSAALVEERGLALWAGTTSDFGVGGTLSAGNWTLRSTTSMTPRDIDRRRRPMFEQVEVARRFVSIGSTSVGGGGGLRQEWDGTSVFIGRVLAGSNVGAGRLQGSLVLERAASQTFRHDAVDLVTTLGWSRRVSSRLSVGMEAIGQDLEGFWDPAEADGGAKLLIGPLLHAESPRGEWSATVTGGPVVSTISTASTPHAPGARRPGGHNFGIFACATWMPSAGR